MKKMQRLLLFTLICYLLLFFPSLSSAKTRQPAFSQKYHSVTVDRKIHFQVNHLVQGHFVRYSLSNPSLAFIHPKTGYFISRKPGTLIIYAKIYNKKNRLITTLKNKLKINAKTQHLVNTSFQIKQPLSTWDFTLSLSCNRILLYEEIKNSKITIYPQQHPDKKITASFSKLSENGKTASYTFSPTEQKKLCPGNRSMDGMYYLTCTHFPKKLSFSYQERISNQTLSGFVFYPNGNPVSKALVSLKTKKSVQKTYTDKNGHYSLKNTAKANYLTVTKSGFLDSTLPAPSPSSVGTNCENVILRPQNASSYLSFSITDTTDQPISNASLVLVKSEKSSSVSAAKFKNHIDSISPQDIIYTGTTDTNGHFRLSNTNDFSALSSGCTQITVDSSVHLAYSSQNLTENNNLQPLFSKKTSTDHSLKETTKIKEAEKHFTADSIQILSPKQLNLAETYTIYISKDDFFLPQKISFSLSDFTTDQIFFHVRLSTCPNATLPSLSLQPSHTSSLSSCQKVSLTFYRTDQKSCIDQHEFIKNDLSFHDSVITTPNITMSHLSENITYYVQVRLYNASNQLLESSLLIPMTIQAGTLVPNLTPPNPVITLSPTYYARFLLYGNPMTSHTKPLTFTLYQKAGTMYYKITDFITESFSKTNNNIFCTNLIVPNLLPDQHYLITCNDTFSILPTTFYSSASFLFPTKKEALFSTVPLSKILCSSVPNDVSPSERKDSVQYFYHTQNEITIDQVRSCQTYLNTVIAFYRADGTFFHSILTDPVSAKRLSFVSKKQYTICDIYTNHSLLSTSQTAYQTSIK